MSPKLVVWTDASSKENLEGVLTTTGYVIKYGNLPPRNGSNTYYGINNSIGEITAGIESLISARKYCNRLGLNPSCCEVEMKTDFDVLSNIINNKLDVNKIEDLKKQNLAKMLKKVQDNFKRVSCEEIYRMVNIAHNVSCLRMRKEVNDNNINGLVQFQKFFYKYPDLCIEKNSDSVAKELIKFLRSQHGEVSVSYETF